MIYLTKANNNCDIVIINNTLHINFADKTIKNHNSKEDTPIQLQPRLFALLEILYINNGYFLSYGELAQKIKGEDTVSSDETIKKDMHELRANINNLCGTGFATKIIKNYRNGALGVEGGYRMIKLDDQNCIRLEYGNETSILDEQESQSKLNYNETPKSHDNKINPQNKPLFSIFISETFRTRLHSRKFIIVALIIFVACASIITTVNIIKRNLTYDELVQNATDAFDDNDYNKAASLYKQIVKQANNYNEKILALGYEAKCYYNIAYDSNDTGTQNIYYRKVTKLVNPLINDTNFLSSDTYGFALGVLSDTYNATGYSPLDSTWSNLITKLEKIADSDIPEENDPYHYQKLDVLNMACSAIVNYYLTLYEYDATATMAPEVNEKAIKYYTTLIYCENSYQEHTGLIDYSYLTYLSKRLFDCMLNASFVADSITDAKKNVQRTRELCENLQELTPLNDANMYSYIVIKRILAKTHWLYGLFSDSDDEREKEFQTLYNESLATIYIDDLEDDIIEEQTGIGTYMILSNQCNKEDIEQIINNYNKYITTDCYNQHDTQYKTNSAFVNCSLCKYIIEQYGYIGSALKSGNDSNNYISKHIDFLPEIYIDSYAELKDFFNNYNPNNSTQSPNETSLDKK